VPDSDQPDGLLACQQVGLLQYHVLRAHNDFMEPLRFRLKNEFKMNYRFVLVIKELLTQRLENKIDQA
jgi:hypothetical protein